MKKAALFIPLLFCLNAGFSQTEIEAKKIIFGFSLGLNETNLRTNDELPLNTKIENGIGFKMGLTMDYSICKNFSFAPKVEIAFNDARVLFFRPDHSINDYKIFPVSAEIMAHVVFKKGEGKFKPYFIVGPSLRVHIPEKTEMPENYATKTDLAIDFGVGLERIFPKLIFAPEIRYSVGLLNVNQHPSLKSLKFNSLSLMFNFKG